MRAAADQGYAAAQYFLGLMYAEGRGVPQDSAEAVNLYRQAADQGYGLAWGVEPPPSAKDLAPLGDRFRPYRSIVARYCWEAVALFRGGTDPSLR